MSEKKDRRIRQRHICDLLRSDLYERTGGIGNEAEWTSPLGWKVIYGCHDPEAEGYQPLHCRIIDPTGKLYAENPDAEVYWLDEALP